MKRILLLSFIGLLGATGSQAQEAETTYAYETFKDTRIVNGQSVEMSVPGQLKFTISHRFGEVNTGWRDLWGLDNSTIRFGLDYGVTDYLTVGVGRSSNQKTFDGNAKLRLLRQSSGAKNFPATITYFTSMALNSSEWADPDRENYFSSRLAYTHQLLIARKFSPRFSAQLMPTLVHRNLIATTDESNDVLAIGGATRYQVFKTLAINLEYYQTLADQINSNIYEEYSLAVGFDIETKGHVFQLHVTNSRGMIEKFFITETTGDFFDGDIHLGFNISRTFTVRGRKHK